METWQHGTQCVVLPDTVQCNTDWALYLVRVWVKSWFMMSKCIPPCAPRRWDLKYTQKVQINMRNVWKFVALLTINFIFEHRCVNCICCNVLYQTNLFPSPPPIFLHSLSLCILCFVYAFVNRTSSRYVLYTVLLICCSTAVVFRVSEINVV
jgi:hypothetical protein